MHGGCLKSSVKGLYQDKVLRPAIGSLERMVGSIGDLLHEETYRRLSFLWNETLFKKLDGLLETGPTEKWKRHRWLCSPLVANTAKIINETLDKIKFLKKMGVSLWDVSMLSANRRKRFSGYQPEITPIHICSELVI
jgi:hypothetical protein